MNLMKELIREVKASMGIYESPDPEMHGLLAEFANPGALYHAAEGVREAGYRHFDTHSPFPIHGMDQAMGLGNSVVGWIAFVGGIAGLSLGTWLQWWTSAVDYPLNISGKPFFAIEPSIPVIFELTILFSAMATVAGMFALNGLPRPYNPLFYSRNFMRVTDDAFFLHVAATDKRFDPGATRALLSELGASNVEIISDPGTSDLED